MRHYSLTLLNQDGHNLLSLPALYKVHGHKSIGIVLIFFAIVFGFESVYEVLLTLGSASLLMADVSVKHLIFAPIGVIFFIWGVNQFFIDGSIVIDQYSVKCEYKRLLGKKSWSKPLSGYKGVEKRVETGMPGGAGSKQLYYTIWLAHKEKDKSIKVYNSWSDEGWDEAHCRYSRLLGVPKLD